MTAKKIRVQSQPELLPSPRAPVTFRDTVGRFLSGMATQVLVLVLIVLDIQNLAMNFCHQYLSRHDFELVLRWASNVILFCFALEIIAKVYVFGRRIFRDWLDVVDVVTIVASLVVEFAMENAFKDLVVVLRLLRVIRVFLLLSIRLRKFNHALSSRSKTVETPMVRAIELLKTLRQDTNPDVSDALGTIIDLLKSRDAYALHVPGMTQETDKHLTDWLERNYTTGVRTEMDAASPASLPAPPTMEEPKPRTGEYMDDSNSLHLYDADEESLSTMSVTVPTEYLTRINEWEFDIWPLADHHEYPPGMGPLSVIGNVILSQYNEAIHRLGMSHSKLNAFTALLEQGYHDDNPYHNAVHAADVLQTVHCLLQHTVLKEWTTDTEKIGLLVAAMMHDYDHPGVNNEYLVSTSDPLALRYNDRSVCENHHVSSVFTNVLTQRDANFMERLTKQDHQRFRSLLVDLVLNTDMTFHFQRLGMWKTKVAMDQTGEDDESRLLTLQMVLHLADVSNPTKPSNVYIRWIRCVMHEFFRQGDWQRERGLPISPFCDSTEANIAACQRGFMEYIVRPLASAFAEFDESFQFISDQLDVNYNLVVDTPSRILAPQPRASLAPPSR